MASTDQSVLPRWRGFNLLDMFTSKSEGHFSESDFQWISEWGFDFVRVPMCYTLWIDNSDPLRINEEKLAPIDRALELSEKYGIHVSLNFHRAPGYSVNRERKEPYSLWKNTDALQAFCKHWTTFAERYKSISSDRLSFDMVNEPPDESPQRMTRNDHERVMRAVVEAIRKVDPDRLIIIDGLSWGNVPSPELAYLKAAQSCRAYLPMTISHYRASWVHESEPIEPAWPGMCRDGEYWDRRRLESHYAAWADLARSGVGVHCGEGGAFSQTPHSIYLAWFRDVLDILTGHNIGYALWNFRGAFGVLDSDRKDVAYEDWNGHKLDRKLLDLLQEF